jgi:release factor glutamine methyltransferase
MQVNQFIQDTTRRLSNVGITTARLDTLVLLGDQLCKNKAWLLANPDYAIPQDALDSLEPKIAARSRRQPLAYIRGWQEFYGRRFTVTSDVLIPRPETENLIDQLALLNLPTNARIIDVGTGSGAIATTTALELPSISVEACDISQSALKIAAQNASQLNAKVNFFDSDLLQNANGKYNAIIANLPYVDESWETSVETKAEPKMAIFAKEQGLELINKLVAQSPDYLLPNGNLLLEADPRQHQTIIKSASNFKLRIQDNFTLVFTYKLA